MSKEISRRNFLQGAALAAGSVALGSGLAGCAGGEEQVAENLPAEEIAQPEAATSVTASARPAPHGGAPLFKGATGPEAEPILPLEPPASWDKEADVVVVGTGYGGMTAVLYAAQAGAKAIAIEKEATIGGASRHAAGMGFYPGGSKAQDAMGYAWPVFPFDPDAAAAKIQEYNNYSIDGKLLRASIIEGGKWFDWITEQEGVNWTCVGMAWMDNDFLSGAHSQVLANDTTFAALEKDALAAGAEILTSTRCEALVSQNGMVLGVKVTDKVTDEEIFIKANKGVILTAGGMGMNLDMLEKYIPTAYMYATQGGPMPWHTGECIRMGLGVGADISGFDSFSCWEGGLDEYWGDGDGSYWHYFWGGATQLVQNPWLLLDKAGDRLPFYLAGPNPVTEGFFGTSLKQKGFDQFTFSMGDLASSAAWMSSVGHRAHCIFDSDYPTNVFIHAKTVKGGDSSRTPLTPEDNVVDNPYVSTDWQAEVDDAIKRGAIKKADTLEELAEQLGLNPEKVVAQVERWNELCEKGEDTDLSIPYLPEWLLPIKNPPFYGAAEGGRIGKTLAGLRINDKMQVLNAVGDIIPGLYAGWFTAGGLIGETNFNGQWGNPSHLGACAASGIGGYMAVTALLEGSSAQG